MPAAARGLASERVVVLLRPHEKQKLARAAQREKVSSGEILRRSLELYLEASSIADKSLLEQLGNALDHMHATLRDTNDHIEKRLLEIERLRQDPEHQKRIAQLDDFIARHSQSPQTQKQRRKAA